MNKLNMVIYGSNMSGKSTFASKFKGAHFISLDHNASYITDNYTNVYNVNEALSDFDNHDKEGNIIVIDTANLLLEWVRLEFLDKMNLEYEGDARDMGKSWYLVKNGQQKLMDKLTNHSKASVIFLFHEEEKIEEDAIGTERTVYQPSVPNARIVGKLMASMTIIGRAVKAKGKYGIDFGSKDEYHLAGARMPHKKKTIMADLDSFKENFPLVFSDEVKKA